MPVEPPEIQLDAKLLAGLTAKAGSKIELPAEVMGKPEPRVKWTKADLVLKPDDRISIDTKPGHSTVTIAKTKRDDSSTYIIEATNSCGRATATVDVNILGKEELGAEAKHAFMMTIINMYIPPQISLALLLPLTFPRSPMIPVSWPGTLHVMMVAPE